MGGGKDIVIFNEMKEDEDFFKRYLLYLIKKQYRFSKPPNDLITSFESKLFPSILHGAAFTSIFTAFLNFVWHEVEDPFEKGELYLLKERSKILSYNKNWRIIERSLNDLHGLNANLSWISYSNLILLHNPIEISEIIGMPEDLVHRKLQLSKAFIIGGVVRGKKLENSILPLLEEQRLIDFFKDVKDFEELGLQEENEEYLFDLEKIGLEIDFEISNLKQMNSDIVSMTKKIDSKFID